MSSYHDYLNILGKVDPSKTVITPEAFQFKLKEALTLSDLDYEKLKKVVKNSALEPSKEWVESEKNKRFQDLFESLWPNLYKNAKDSKKDEENAKKISELEKKKLIIDMLLKQDIETTKHLLQTKPIFPPEPTKTTTMSTTTFYNFDSLIAPKQNEKINISIGLNSNHPNIEITTPNWSTQSSSHNESSKTLSKYPNQVSGYDFPYNTKKYSESIVKSSYNSDDLKKETELLKSIQQAQEKLKISQKMEKTTDLVDDIISKVTILQNEMKKKSAAIKLEEEIIKKKREQEELQNLRKSLTSLNSSHLLNYHSSRLEDFDLDHHHHHHHHHNAHRSKSRDSLHASRSTSKEKDHYHSHCHSCHSHKSNIMKPKSSMSKYPTESVSRIRKSSSASRRKSISSIGPKVNCWNLNCKHDENIY